MPGETQPVALVLAGGGARGAYEAGALSVLLPALEERGERPQIILGTSAGALNTAYLAANAQLPAATLVPEALAVWQSITWSEVARPLISPATLQRVISYLGEAAGVPGAAIESLLDPAPLRKTIAEQIDFAQLERNVRRGVITAAGVAATSARTGRSVVFHRGLSSPPQDTRRGITYVGGRLREEHVLASSAIPSVFPAVHVTAPRGARGWYFDGGTRLNTPIKPAVAFGARRVVVVAVGSVALPPGPLAGEKRPDALAGAGEILLGLLDDQLANDIQTLVSMNQMMAAAGSENLAGKRPIPYILIAPQTDTRIGEIALRVVRRHYSGALQTLRSPDVALLARLTGGGVDTQHAELVSFLLFAREFASALIELGQEDARRWLAVRHDCDDLWQLGPLE